MYNSLTYLWDVYKKKKYARALIIIIMYDNLSIIICNDRGGGDDSTGDRGRGTAGILFGGTYIYDNIIIISIV